MAAIIICSDFGAPQNKVWHCSTVSPSISHTLVTWCKKTDSLEKTMMLGKTEGGRRRGWQRLRWLDGITNSIDMNLSRSGSWWWTGKPGVLQSLGSQRVEHDWATELMLISKQVRLWLTNFAWGHALLRKTECSVLFQNSSFFSPPARSWRGFFSDIYCRKLIEHMKMNLTAQFLIFHSV